MRVDGDAHGVENFDQHQDNEELVEDEQCLASDAPMSESLPKRFAGASNGRERGYEQQDGENRIDYDFGTAEIVAEVDTELFLGHLVPFPE
jgi:hypothetical protein